MLLQQQVVPLDFSQKPSGFWVGEHEAELVGDEPVSRFGAINIRQALRLTDGLLPSCSASQAYLFEKTVEAADTPTLTLTH